MTSPPYRTLVFDTTHAALWAEEVAREARIPVEVVPAPSESGARCDLALVTPWDRGAGLAAALVDAGVAWRWWPPAETPGRQ